MLAPETRTLLTDCLRPPEGYRVDTAVATTYSLNLMALLLAPMSFALHDYDPEGAEQPDPIKLLESVRRHALHTTVFCQAGAIHVPDNYRSILIAAEDSVQEVKAPAARRVFHPKIWVLRFATPAGEYLHRVLCLSRNLTFDRSWDTLLRLDEQEDDADAVIEDTKPLIDFVRRLPGLALRPLSAARAEQIADLASSLRPIRFALPDGADGGAFVPLGLSNEEQWPLAMQPAPDRIVAISPFLDVATVKYLASLAPETTFLSRPESYERVGAAGFSESCSTWAFQRAAEIEVGDDTQEPVELVNEHSDPPDGLHAKTFIAEYGNRAVVVTGSANATRAGWNGNVEFSVRLEGSAKLWGKDAIWEGSKEAPGLSRMLAPYLITSHDGDVPPNAAIDWDIEQFHLRIAESGPKLYLYDVQDRRAWVSLVVEVPSDMPGTTRVWPIGRGAEIDARDLVHSPINWGPMALRNVTPFLAFETTSGMGKEQVTRRAVITAELIDDVDERRHDALRDTLASRHDVLRYLVFLLGDPAYDDWFANTGAGLGRSWEADPSRGLNLELALFEPMVRAVARDDDSLERIEALVRDLRAMPDGPDLIPEGFDALWDVAWQVYKEGRP